MIERFALLDRHETLRYDERDDCKVVPLSRWAKIVTWLLKKTRHKVVRQEEVRSVEWDHVYHEDIGDMLKSIMRQKHYIMLWNNEIDRVIVGRDWYQKILRKTLDDNGPVAFASDIRLDNRGETRVAGIIVQCIPWIEGFVVIPKMERGK